MDSILVTGGTGSLGRALISSFLASDRWSRVVSISRDEVKAGDLAEEHAHDPRFRCFLGDVRDFQRLQDSFVGIDVVVHAAALKRVQQSAYNPGELIATNIYGTQNVIRAAAARGVKLVVFCSSDKSVMATNLYGSTKHTAETYAVQANTYTYPQGMRVAAVRYGNVLASRGSVVPLWIDAVAKNEPLQLTHTEMTRFWLTLPDAVGIVDHAIEYAKGGEVFVPILPSVRLVDVAAAIAGPDYPRVIVGLRPGGEKMHEQLLSEEETSRTVLHQSFYVVLPSHRSWSAEPWRGEPVDADMIYRSDLNDWWLDRDEIRNAIKIHLPNSRSRVYA